MDRKKILHITQATGGVKTYVAHLIDFIDSEKFEIVVIAPKDDNFSQHCADKKIRHYEVDLHRGVNPIKNMIGMFKIMSIIKKERPHLVHAHSAKGGFLGRLAGRYKKTKVIYTPHAFSYLSFTGITRVVYYLLEYITKNSSETLLAISYSEANRALYELGYRPLKVKTILNAIPRSEVPPVYEIREKLKIRMIGRLTYQKNPIFFLEIAKCLHIKYPDIQFDILGAGIHDHLTNEINNYIQENDLENAVKILRWGDGNTSKDFLKETDIFVMTSIFEGLSYSLLEAMSMGIPCVVSNVDGNNDVIKNNENGFSCLSLEEFYQKIDLLIRNGELRKKMGMAGYKYVRTNHSMIDNIQMVEELYEQVANAIVKQDNKRQGQKPPEFEIIICND